MTHNTASPVAALDFTGRTVLVTGGGVGIGRGIAEAFVAAGASVVIAEIDPQRAADVAAALPTARVVVCDVLDRGTPALLAHRIASRQRPAGWTCWSTMSAISSTRCLSRCWTKTRSTRS